MGTQYHDSTTRSLLRRLQMTSPKHDGSTSILDILASFWCSKRKWSGSVHLQLCRWLKPKSGYIFCSLVATWCTSYHLLMKYMYMANVLCTELHLWHVLFSTNCKYNYTYKVHKQSVHLCRNMHLENTPTGKSKASRLQQYKSLRHPVLTRSKAFGISSDGRWCNASGKKLFMYSYPLEYTEGTFDSTQSVYEISLQYLNNKLRS